VTDRDLCRGPGNLTAALGIDDALNTRPLYRRPLTVEDRGGRVAEVDWGPRIGISSGLDRLWRCHVRGHAAVSARRSGGA
jgi:DNA-3-methyladenine glycosylase